MYKTDYVIAIPTYNRAEMIKKKTLKLLEKYLINPSKIYIFVANAEQYELYIEELDIKYSNNIIIGQLGLLNQRKFISNYFPEGQWILQMDDDIDNIVFLNDDNKKEVELLEDLESFVYTSFLECKKNKICCWGIHPTDNPFYMSHGISINLKLIVGCFFGIINDRELENKVAITEKEDFERTILYFEKYGKIMRHNYVGVDTNYFKNSGGLQSPELNHNRIEKAFESVHYLLEKYPYCCTRKDKKNLPDIRLNYRYKSQTKKS